MFWIGVLLFVSLFVVVLLLAGIVVGYLDWLLLFFWVNLWLDGLINVGLCFRF